MAPHFFGSSSDHLRVGFGKTVLFPKGFRRRPEGLLYKIEGILILWIIFELLTFILLVILIKNWSLYAILH
ncbi:MAG: hypothetical protein DI622_14600 [Chryseobacterium sp.]|nr:MAG: hypothetical protein DI622_14600 [Chryseobacterium sp.]